MRKISLLTLMALLLSGGLYAQYTVTVTGHIIPCNGPTWVSIQTLPGTQPFAFDTVWTNANCYYEFTLELMNETGWIQISAPTGTGTVASNTGMYTGSGAITIDIMSGGNSGDCQAGFTIMQGMDSGSPNMPGNPIPNEVWLIDQSFSSFPPLTYTWDFGDGSTSTDPTPEHMYPSNGGYFLCLTISDATGCANMFCDTVNVDENGLLGMMLSGVNNVNARNGFILRVFSDSMITTGVETVTGLENALLWPNPVEDMLNIALPSAMGGTIVYSVIDALGREVAMGNRGLNNGLDRFEISVGSLVTGSYLLRISINGTSETYRFIKQ